MSLDEESRVRIAAVARELVLPELVSANNVEVMAMSVGLFNHVLTEPWDTEMPLEIGRAHRAYVRLLRRFDPTWEPTPENLDKLKGNVRELGTPVHFASFVSGWIKDCFARLEIGHRRAAALCLTDVPYDLELHAPWATWSLVVPDGLLGDVARLWCFDEHPQFVVMRDGSVHSGLDDPLLTMVRNLARGAVLAMEAAQAKTETSARPCPSVRRRVKGAPDFTQVRFKMSAPVNVDLREHVRTALAPNTQEGAKLKVQFLVRGHWRNQVHGPGNSLRKLTWIQPFWKGPEESRVLLRAHQKGVAEAAE
jgi:hypothetical protein